MPADPNTIAAATDGINQVANTISTNDINRRTQRFAREQYARQRADNLADWEMQNAYNSPAAQMQRLKDAGLNPNLVYGNGADATSSQMPRNADTGSWNPETPRIQFSAQNALSNYYDAQVKQATVDNLKVQNTVLTQDAILRASQVGQTNAQTESIQTSTAEGKNRLKYADQLSQISLEALRQSVNKTMADTEFTQNSDKRAEAMNKAQVYQISQNIINQRKLTAETLTMGSAQRKKIDQEIKESQSRINNLDNTGKLQQLDIQLKESGLQPSDPAYMRIINRILTGDIDPVRDFKKIFVDEVGTTPEQHKNTITTGVKR